MMPWHVGKSSECPVSKPWAVIKDADNGVEGCHPTKKAAQQQMAALYANEGQAMSANVAESRQVPTKNLCRTATLTLRAAPESRDNTDGRTIDGVAAVFDTFTRISSLFEGTFDEEIRRGAFSKSLKERVPRMQFDHGRHPMLGSLPLGTWTEMQERADGLHVVGRLSDNWLVQPFRDAIADGAIDGMSIRMEVVRDEWRTLEGEILSDLEEILDRLYSSGDEPLRRTIREAKLFEAGPVTWPAYETTSVGVRSLVIDLARLHEPEQRANLARAVILADQAVSFDTEDMDASQSTTDRDENDSVAGEHPSDEVTEDSPQSTTDRDENDSVAGEHESESDRTHNRDDVDLTREQQQARYFASVLAEIANRERVTAYSSE